MNPTDRKYCQGCTIYEWAFDPEVNPSLPGIQVSSCGVERKECNEDGSCPCTECIIKPMCSESCEKMSEWIYKKRGMVGPNDS